MFQLTQTNKKNFYKLWCKSSISRLKRLSDDKTIVKDVLLDFIKNLEK